MAEKPVISMIVPGRRALGETWSKVHIVPNADTGEYDVVREDAEQPSDNRPIFIVGLGNVGLDILEYALGDQREKAKTRAKRPREDLTKELNHMWQDYVREKIEWFNGRSQFGPAGFTQREKVQR